MEFKRDEFSNVKAISKDGGSIESQSVEANLLLAILEKLDEIRCGLIDIETVLENK